MLTAVAALLAAAAVMTPTTASAAPPPKDPPLKAAPPQARRYIAITTAASPKCPLVTSDGNWKGGALFRTKQPELQRFCTYTWAGPADAKVLTFPGGDFHRADPDYDVLLPQAELGADNEVRSALRNTWRKSMGLTSHTQTQYISPANPAARPLAQVAILDTADRLRPYASAAPQLQHGLAMAQIVHEVRCPAGEAACVPYTSFVPVIEPCPPTVQGSSESLGSLGSLAHGIDQALADWQDSNPQPPVSDAPLVLNLSLGWDPRWMPQGWEGSTLWDITDRANHDDLLVHPSDSIPAPVQAVHAALVRASCFDVLTIAAAGNNTGGGCEQQEATAPGKWEQLLAPDPSVCSRLFKAELPTARPVNPNITTPRRPLVYAAGALLTTQDQLLPITRVRGVPPRVLPASHVVVGADSNRTDAWTGTSVAAAALSGLAANLWSHDLRLTSHQVMALIDATSEALPGVRSTLLSEPAVPSQPPKSPPQPAVPSPPPKSPPQPAVRVSAYRAFKGLCAGKPEICADNPYAPSSTASTATFAAAIADEPLPEGLSKRLGLPSHEYLASTRCSVKRTHYYATMGPPPPVTASADVMAWTRPQPETSICSVCPIKGKKLVLSLNPDHASLLTVVGSNVILDNPLLEFRFGTAGYISVSLGQVAVGSSGLELALDAYRITLDGVEVPLAQALQDHAITAGTLTIFITSNTRVKSLVSVVQVLD